MGLFNIFRKVSDLLVSAVFDLGKQIARVLQSVLDYNEEATIREAQHRVREAESKYVATLDRIAVDWQNIQRLKEQGEYMRRGALLQYYRANLALINEYLRALETVKKTVFETTKRVQIAVEKAVPPKDKLTPTWREFKRKISDLHGCIAASKAISDQLKFLQVKIIDERNALTNSSTHRKLGAKRKIQAILDEEKLNAIQKFSLKGDAYIKLELGSSLFVLHKKCKCRGCGVALAKEMQHCYLCGDARDADMAALRFSRKQTTSFSCNRCHAPLSPQFRYCYNCGLGFDPYNFHSLLRPPVRMRSTQVVETDWD